MYTGADFGGRFGMTLALISGYNKLTVPHDGVGVNDVRKTYASMYFCSLLTVNLPCRINGKTFGLSLKISTLPGKRK